MQGQCQLRAGARSMPSAGNSFHAEVRSRARSLLVAKLLICFEITKHYPIFSFKTNKKTQRRFDTFNGKREHI